MARRKVIASTAISRAARRKVRINIPFFSVGECDEKLKRPCPNARNLRPRSLWNTPALCERLPKRFPILDEEEISIADDDSHLRGRTSGMRSRHDARPSQGASR